MAVHYIWSNYEGAAPDRFGRCSRHKKGNKETFIISSEALPWGEKELKRFEYKTEVARSQKPIR